MVDEPRLPNSDTAEKAVLKGILDNPEVRYTLAAVLQPEDFYQEQNGIIYAAMLDMNGTEPNLLTLNDTLDRTGQLKDAGGSSYLFRLATAEYYIPPQEAERHAQTVADYAVRRRLIHAASAITKTAWSEDGATATAAAYTELEKVRNRTSTGLIPVAGSVSLLYDQIEAWSRDPLEYGQVRGLATNIPSLDHLTGGLNPGELTLLAARPAMGKSALALEIVRRVGMAGGRVAVFELEMTRQNILMRWASCVSRVETRKIKRGACPDKYLGQSASKHYASADEMARYIQALAEMDALRTVAIDDSGGIGTTDIRLRATQFANQLGGLDLVVVDHTDIIKASGGRNENSAKTEGRKSREMHELAKELDCPVLLVQQLNRGVEGRQNKRPQLGDLRDSGEHEQNADLVLGLYRESYYKQTIAGSEKDLELEVLSLKNREGPTAMVRLRYERHLHRFTEFQKGV